MPGLAKSSQFLLSSATVMLGAKTDLFNLNPAAHSIGLAKNFQMSLDPGYVELGQGISNSIVMSVRNSEQLRASFEVYEYTLRNLAYASGIDASGVNFVPQAGLNLSTAVAAAAAVVISVTGDQTLVYPIGTYFFIQYPSTDSANSDIVHVAKVTAVAFSTTTQITFTGYAIPTGVSFPIGSRVGVVKRVDLATGALFQPELACKIVGVLPQNNEPFVILLPKVKITRGLNINFSTDNFTNMPFELTPYVQNSSDPFFTEFGSTSAVLLPR